LTGLLATLLGVGALKPLHLVVCLLLVVIAVGAILLAVRRK